MKLLMLLATMVAMSCGSTDSNTTDTSKQIFSLSGEDTQNQKIWGSGRLHITEQRLILYTRHFPVAAFGDVSLPTCADLDPELKVGIFVCNSDGTQQDIKAKNVVQVCNLPTESSPVTRAQDEMLSIENCLTGTAYSTPLNVKLNYAIEDL